MQTGVEIEPNAGCVFRSQIHGKPLISIINIAILLKVKTKEKPLISIQEYKERLLEIYRPVEIHVD